MSGGIVDLSASPPPERLSVEVCIVGSGCGGATAAWELARAGRDVLVLEEGADFTGSALTQRDAEMYDQLYMDRGARSTSDLGVSVMQGRVLGGGGVINASDVVPIPDEVLRHWEVGHGLSDFAPEKLAPFRSAALLDLSANLPGEERLNENNRLLRKGARALGWKGEVMMHNRVGCAGVGSCLIGCPLDAKRSPRFVAVPNAVEAGARFFLRARAVRIDSALAEEKTVQVRVLDGKGYREVGAFEVKAKQVVLAANAIASPQLLLRSGIGNQQVGRNLMLQPQLPVTGIYKKEVRFFRGIPQSYAVTEHELPATERRGWWGFRLESISGTPGIVGSLLPAIGPAGKELMTRYANFAALLCLLPDEPVGRVRLERSGRLRIDYALTDEIRARFRLAARAAARCFFASGADQVLVPAAPPLYLRSEADLPELDGLSLEPATVPLMSAHQQGSVRFAPSERDGGASPDGQVYGTRGVYVFDSSGFPSSASSHTMTPIITVSRYLTQRLLGG
ncbi:MAG: GMC family oxidoreductase [Myxococcales bacterium]|nr:GMC family oxidoreductase [Myxococcales bacterium]